ncbi:MunI family type II restriction endonuclease [Sphingobium indicum]|uniref:Restriction endonuclease n=1 Tax=Sphingobium indicum (strain DSM 16412 / CCM 7286 / MTCC 6364 / B90A) TaxID=861109 RepID=A0A1L5BRG4_SPHIB|nr:MunI family type II restriction endonuclease [Sphingobium indicum]APL95485.1 restriction endonuclease [Sphingobium indicum B90A]
MGTEALRGRAVWQDYSGANAGFAEQSFFAVFTEAFRGTELSIRAKPQEFKHIYVDVPLADDVIAEIYNPECGITKHGITPDYAIDNKGAGKTLYVEVKRQDGWVEGKPRSAGRGNAHERSNKFFTPGLLKTLRKRGNLGPDALPFWTVFQGDIARDPCRVREITLWYDGYPGHYFMWRDNSDPTALLRHFDEHLRPLLA